MSTYSYDVILLCLLLPSAYDLVYFPVISASGYFKTNRDKKERKYKNIETEARRFRKIPVEMSLQARCFSILGDSNVSRNMTALNRRASPLMDGCQVITCRKLSTLSDSLRSVRSSSNSCIVSCLTNFFTDLSTRSSSNIGARVEPVLEELRGVFSEFCTSNPDVMLLVAPPMYRLSPDWYRQGLPEILHQFSKGMSGLLSPSFHLLPSFPFPEFDEGGVHLTAYAGLKFVVQLFDSSLDLIKGLSATTPVAVAHVSEATRVLEDRVVTLEQDHRHLRSQFQMKTAIDSELADFEENVRNECYFVISGLPQVPPELTGRDWQDHAKGLVQAKIKLILGRESKIIVVSGLRRDEKPVYLVKLESTEDSKRIRDKFGSSFKAGATPLPPGLKGLSIRSRVTHATRVRLAIMQVLAHNYKKSNPGSRTQVVNYVPRPLMRLTPPAGASDPRVQSYNFIEAVTKLPLKFSKSGMAEIMKSVSGKFKGQLRSLFVAISDDDRVGRDHSDSATSSENSGSSSESETEEVRVSETRVPEASASAERVSAGELSRSRTEAVDSGRGSKRGPPSSKGNRNKSRR